MIESEFVVVTADMCIVSGCKFDSGGILILFCFRGVGFELSRKHHFLFVVCSTVWVTESAVVGRIVLAGQKGEGDCILGVRDDQGIVPSTGRGS